MRSIHCQIWSAEMRGAGRIEHLAAKFQAEAFGELEVTGNQEVLIHEARHAVGWARGRSRVSRAGRYGKREWEAGLGCRAARLHNETAASCQSPKTTRFTVFPVMSPLLPPKGRL